MAGVQLPAGWTLEEIRDVSGNRESVALDTDRVVALVGGPGEGERLHPEIVLGFHGLRLVKPVNDEDWCMGSPMAVSTAGAPTTTSTRRFGL
ncbi:hypothetical protein ACFYO2_17350 [Streptomyces sp. NPDC006602]|uniref:hypothetical protein n=1 Tax=Streptomyces sp. NPDC006602 TaxID=3364751 RepID=UPI0036B7ACFC